MTPIKKADTDKKFVRDAFSLVRAGMDEGMAILELTLLELALAKLHINREKIRREGMKAVREEQTSIFKLRRAVAKSALSTRQYDYALELLEKAETPRKLSDKQWVEPHVRDDGTIKVRGYWRKLQGSEEQTPETKEKIREVQGERKKKRKEALQTSPKEAALFALDDVDRLSEGALDAAHDDTYRGAIRAFLNENSVGQGIAATAGFFANSGNKFQFAARAISEFGPWTGTRIAYNYFRYGGYDVPMRYTPDGKVITEMGDTLPSPGDVEKTRNWAIKALKSRLPGSGADERDAEPPSEGFIIDGKGNVLAHAVGRGHDHFIPFNAKHLRQLRKTEDVEYVRRRMYGGPTAEDLHAAMALGADRVTVVSNGGTFSFELSDRSHGIKLEHFQVLMRYQEVLDSQEGILDYDAYDTAMDTMSAEFPLHFFKVQSDQGEWANKVDRIQPANRLTEGLRDMFSALGGDDDDVQGNTKRGASWSPNLGQSKDPAKIKENMFPGIGNRTVRDYVREKKRRGASDNEILNALDRFYRATSQQSARQIGWVRQDFGLDQKSQSQNQRSLNTVTTRKADPVQERAKNAQRATPIKPSDIQSLNSTARDRFEQVFGTRTPVPDRRNLKRASEIIERANNASDEEWEKEMSDSDLFEDILDSFEPDTIDFG